MKTYARIYRYCLFSSNKSKRLLKTSLVTFVPDSGLNNLFMVIVLHSEKVSFVVTNTLYHEKKLCKSTSGINEKGIT